MDEMRRDASVDAQVATALRHAQESDRKAALVESERNDLMVEVESGKNEIAILKDQLRTVQASGGR